MAGARRRLSSTDEHRACDHTAIGALHRTQITRLSSFGLTAFARTGKMPVSISTTESPDYYKDSGNFGRASVCTREVWNFDLEIKT
jgi:hypothetical protein